MLDFSHLTFFTQAKVKPKPKKEPKKRSSEPKDPPAKRKPKKKPEALVPQQAIMAGIMLTSGPVTIQRVITNTSTFHKISKEQFCNAVDSLKEANLGEVIDVQTSKNGSMSKVFVKKHPAEAALVLEHYPDLCTTEQYTTKYEQSPSKSIPLKLRSKLVEMGVVFEKQMK